MESSGYIGLSRMIVQQRALEVRAANIANVATPGFKAESVSFSDYVVRQQGAAAPPGGRVVQMVQDRATWRDFNQGELSKTGNPLDVALQGDGFFVVDTPRGERYTRAGRFSLSAAGQIVDMSGNAVLGADSRPISVPSGAGAIAIAGDGSVAASSGPIGKLRVVEFDSLQSLQAEGGSVFATTQTPRDATQPQVVQGAVEGANVQAVVELTRMMDEMRQFDFASQLVDGEAQREQSAIDRIGHKS